MNETKTVIRYLRLTPDEAARVDAYALAERRPHASMLAALVLEALRAREATRRAAWE